MKKNTEQLSYEIELIINENLYKKNFITEDIYKKVNEKLLKLIEIVKIRNITINTRYAKIETIYIIFKISYECFFFPKKSAINRKE